MKLEGIHHVTAITADAPRNVDFYARVLGLRLVKKTRQPGRPDRLPPVLRRRARLAGSDITFFEYPGAAAAAPARGMVHRVAFRVALRRGARLLGGAARRARASRPSGPTATLRFADPEGLGLELRVVDDRGRAADRRPPGDAARARAAGLRRRRAPTRVDPEQSRALPRAGARLRRRTATTSARCAATSAAGSTRYDARARARRSAAPAPCTTSPGPRRWTSTRPGGSASRRPAPARRR